MSESTGANQRLGEASVAPFIVSRFCSTSKLVGLFSLMGSQTVAFRRTQGRTARGRSRSRLRRRRVTHERCRTHMIRIQGIAIVAARLQAAVFSPLPIGGASHAGLETHTEGRNNHTTVKRDLYEYVRTRLVARRRSGVDTHDLAATALRGPTHI